VFFWIIDLWWNLDCDSHLSLKYDYLIENGYCIAYDENSRQQTISSLGYTAFTVVITVIASLP